MICCVIVNTAVHLPSSVFRDTLHGVIDLLAVKWRR